MELYHLRHEISHRFCRSVLLLSGGVGVGAEGEARIIVPKHTADRFHIYAVLEGQGCESVSQVVEADMLQSSVLQYLLVELHHRIGVVHLSGDRRGEHVLVVRVLAVFLNQQIDRVLRDGHLPHRSFRLWPGEHYLPAGVADVLLADGDCLVCHVQVAPKERHQFAFPQSADQLQIEHGKYSSSVGGIKIGLEVFG